MKSNKIFTALAAMAMAMAITAGPVVSQEVRPGIFKVSNSENQKINRFGVCKLVKNRSGKSIMVPVGTKEEWSTGAKSFISNVGNMPGVGVGPCDRLDNACFFWVSGIGPSNVNDYNNRKARIGDVSLNWDTGIAGQTGGSNMVGEGEYPDAYGSKASPGPFFRAANGSFDGIAVGKDTTVTFWLKTNYGGAVALKVVGPKVLVNQAFSENRPYFREGYLNDSWSANGAIFAQFPPSTRGIARNLSVPLPTNRIPTYPPGANAGEDTFATNPKYPLWALGFGSVKVECD